MFLQMINISLVFLIFSKYWSLKLDNSKREKIVDKSVMWVKWLFVILSSLIMLMTYLSIKSFQGKTFNEEKYA